MTLEETMNALAVKENKPIRTKEELLATKYVLNCTPMDEEWNEWQKNSWWSTKYNKPEEMLTDERIKRVLPLRNKLLSFGGEEVCLDLLEEDYDNIMSFGQVWIGKNIKLMKGRPSGCHSNVAELYDLNHKDVSAAGNMMRIATGYALSPDGLWRQHSWLVYRIDGKLKIIETTVKRLLYFGFALDEEMCERWLYENLY